MTQARIAETEKYAHVTFFFNGGVEEPNKGEDRILVKSPKVATYDLKPEMSAYEVCDKLVDAIKADKYDVIVINFANPDMVGHTGVEAAVIKAIEAVDECVGKAGLFRKIFGRYRGKCQKYRQHPLIHLRDQSLPVCFHKHKCRH